MNPHEKPSSTEPSKKRRKGGAEKLRDKKRQLLQHEAKACRKLTDIFVKEREIRSQQAESSEGTPVIPGTSGCMENERQFSEMSSSEDLVGVETPSSSVPGIVLIPTLAEDTTFRSIESSSVQLIRPDASAPTQESVLCNDGSLHPTASSEQPPDDPREATPILERQQSSVEKNDKFDLFAIPENRAFHYFFQCHPQQPEDVKLFNPKIAYFRRDGTRRMWLTYQTSSSTFFCCVCMAFLKEQPNRFIYGFKPSNKKHLYDRLHEHEKSFPHTKAVDAYILFKNSKSVDIVFRKSFIDQRRAEISRNRQLLERLLDVVKLIGKQCLSFRGKRNEAAYSLLNPELNHGTFLEVILLLARYDPPLKEHVETVTKKSEKNRLKGNKQGGASVTFLSKTFVNYIVEAIGALIKTFISTEVKQAGMFSVQIDSTSDNSMTEQCSIVLRYMKSDSLEPSETLFALKSCESTTGLAFYDLVKNELARFEIDIKQCIASSTDGAASMQGKYNGFVALLKKENSLAMTVWCHSHVLNLVITDCTSEVLEAAALFELLNKAFTFIRDSYKRMKIWKEISKSRGLTLIGETRWWAKSVALTKIFGTLDSFDNCHYGNLVLTLHDISSSKEISAEARVTGAGIVERLTSYETILTAHIFKKVFVYTTPLSNYLQTKGMDILTAFNMIEATKRQLRDISRQYPSVVAAADQFVDYFQQKFEDNNIVISGFKNVRSRKKKTFFEYEQPDTPLDPARHFEIAVHNRILDVIVESFQRRFESHHSMYASFAFLDPRNFRLVNPSESSFTNIVAALKNVSVEVEEGDVKNEYQDFISKWFDIVKNQVADTHSATEKENSDTDEGDLVGFVPHGDDKKCNNCVVCVYQVLKQYNLMSSSYGNLFLVYKFLLTLSTTQVECERSFSKLKIIKTRLRQTLSDSNLEFLMLMACESSFLRLVTCENLIKEMCKLHPSLKRYFFE